MDTTPRQEPLSQVLEIIAPVVERAPLVFASPHSGSFYSTDFLNASALDPQSLRRSEDSYVDELFGAAPRHGAPLLRALFPRAYLDVNREPWELDPEMFDGPLPTYVNHDSVRVAAGLGTIARVVATGADIYRRKLSFDEAEQRVRRLYFPYHAALKRLIDETVDLFGCCLLIDCHSMPSIGTPLEADAGAARVDFVLGDCFGSSCAPFITRTVEHTLRRQGHRVVRNTPYAGGYTTRHYGNPAKGVHVLQIETNRRLYMDEYSHARRSPAFDLLQHDLGLLIAALTAIPAMDMIP